LRLRRKPNAGETPEGKVNLTNIDYPNVTMAALSKRTMLRDIHACRYDRSVAEPADDPTISAARSEAGLSMMDMKFETFEAVHHGDAESVYEQGQVFLGLQNLDANGMPSLAFHARCHSHVSCRGVFP